MHFLTGDVCGLEQLEDLRTQMFGRDRQVLAAISQRVEQASASSPAHAESSGNAPATPEASGSTPADDTPESPIASGSEIGDEISASPRASGSNPADDTPASCRASAAGSHGPEPHAGPPDLLGFGAAQTFVPGTSGQAEDVLGLVEQAKRVLQAQGVWAMAAGKD
jgi:hypothetical protein